MKNAIVIFLGVFMFTITSSILISCDNSKTDQEEPENIENTDQDAAIDSAGVDGADQNMDVIVNYQCSMKCEGDKTYEHAGTCPVCGMDLVKIKTTEIEIE